MKKPEPFSPSEIFLAEGAFAAGWKMGLERALEPDIKINRRAYVKLAEILYCTRPPKFWQPTAAPAPGEEAKR